MNRPFLKLLIALVVCAILIFNISGSFLKKSGSARLAEEQLERGSLKIDHAVMTVSELNDRMVASGDHFIENLHKHAELMANMLSHLIQDGKYTGPYDFEEGVVVRFENNQYEILGNRSPELYPALEPTYFEQDGSYIPSYLIKAGDVIEITEKAKGLQRYKDILEVTAGRLVPEWIDVDQENFKGTIKELPTREMIDVPVDEMLIVELYSK